MSDDGLWLVTWAYYSEQACVAVVAAPDADEAKRRALALGDDPEMTAARLDRLEVVDARPVSDGLYLGVWAEH